MLAAAAAVLVVVVASSTVAYVLLQRANSDETRIRALVDDFAGAADRGDGPKVVSLLCSEEARDVTDDDDYDPNDSGVPSTGQARYPPVRTSDVRVRGSTASARVARPPMPAATVYFRKEAGAWKVCAYAADQFSASPSPSK